MAAAAHFVYPGYLFYLFLLLLFGATFAKTLECTQMNYASKHVARS